MTLRLGLVNYLNVSPFKEINYPIYYDVPSRLNQLLQEGQLDIAFASSVTYLLGDFDCLPGFGLASHGAIDSVFLYLKEGEKLDGASLFLDPASATGNMLLRLLCAYYWKVEPRFVQSKEECVGFVKIGDWALRRPHINGYRTIDLGLSWFEATNLPFVFALFITQKGLRERASNELAELENKLSFSLESFMHNLPHRVEHLAKTTHLPGEKLASYFKLCHYRIGSKEREGLHHFKKLVDTYVCSVSA
ncbi:MAG: menaquinone biosynthesis protein [Chlamydiales bacterium]